MDKGETMTEIHIWHDGDTDAGITGDDAKLVMDISWMDEEDVCGLYDILKDAFAEIWGMGGVKIEIDEEMR